jgi:hypothetical protein
MDVISMVRVWQGLERTDGSGLNHVADGESLDRLVLRSATSAVGAAHGLDVAAAVLVATAAEKNENVSMDPFTQELEVQYFPSSFNSIVETTAYTADILDRREIQALPSAVADLQI